MSTRTAETDRPRFSLICVSALYFVNVRGLKRNEWIEQTRGSILQLFSGIRAWAFQGPEEQHRECRVQKAKATLLPHSLQGSRVSHFMPIKIKLELINTEAEFWLNAKTDS